MSLFEDLLKVVFPLALEGIKKLADSQVDGATLSKDQKRALYLGYIAVELKFKELVDSTDNEFDDAGMAALSEFARDTLEEAGIETPVIPLELLD